mmetsp:Transcript_24184/g.61999  ORF Transcript_24184/g.61999 Transcript_24184/m.61999 type:complete len:352 (-) Transcript_24184:167-1222(-)
MQDAECHVAKQHKCHFLVQQRELRGECEEPGEVGRHGGDLVAQRHVGLGGQHERNALPVQAPLGEHEHGDPVPVLVRHKQLGGLVKHHRGGVVLGEERPEEGVRHCEHGQVLDVGVVVRAVGHDMVHVVRVLPPADADAVAKVASEEANGVVPLSHVGDAGVPGVMPQESGLLPERRDKDGGRKHIVLERKVDAQADEGRHQCTPAGVEGVVGVVQPRLVELLHHLAVRLLVRRELAVGGALHVRDVVAAEHVAHVAGVVRVELVRHVAPGAELDCLHAPGVLFRPSRQVVRLAVDRHPQVVVARVSRELLPGHRLRPLGLAALRQPRRLVLAHGGLRFVPVLDHSFPAVI